jgi:hypothetical protein
LGEGGGEFFDGADYVAIIPKKILALIDNTVVKKLPIYRICFNVVHHPGINLAKQEFNFL